MSKQEEGEEEKRHDGSHGIQERGKAKSRTGGVGTDNEVVAFFDAHMHWWDTTATRNDNLGDIVTTLPKYLPEHYDKDIATAEDVRLVGATHVETVVGQCEGGFKLDPVAETTFVHKQAAHRDATAPVAIVAFVHLGRHDAKLLLQQHMKASPLVVGVRMIQNYHCDDASLTWPQVDRGDWWHHDTFASNFRVLADLGLSFDCQINPHQLLDAAKFFAHHRRVPVVVNHMGCLKLSDVVDGTPACVERVTVWRKGMAALAVLPHVFVKLSFPTYTLNEWMTDATARDCIVAHMRHVVTMFGAARCMFASNFPVDKHMGASFSQLVALFRRVAAPLTARERSDLFAGTAKRVYATRHTHTE